MTPTRPPVREGIDLRRCDVVELLADLTARRVVADLVVADPPWEYSRDDPSAGSDPGDHYTTLSTPAIREHVRTARPVGRRLVLWCTWPLLPEWVGHDLAGWRWVTGGAWAKSDGRTGPYGQGYHWAGCSEPVLLYTGGADAKGAHLDRSVPLRNAWHEEPGPHSAKPIAWQEQWIRRWVPPGGLVVDMYAGLGTVARATLRAGGGRRYVGAELDDKRHAAALALLAQERTT